MERVEFVAGEEVDIPLDELLWHEMSSNIEMHPSPGKPGGVFDKDARDFPRNATNRRILLKLRRQKLEERLFAVKNARRGLRSDADKVRRHRQLISFGTGRFACQGHGKEDGVLRALDFRIQNNRQGKSCRTTELAGKEGRHIPKRPRLLVHEYSCPRVDRKLPRRFFDLQWLGDDRDGRTGNRPVASRGREEKGDQEEEWREQARVGAHGVLWH